MESTRKSAQSATKGSLNSPRASRIAPPADFTMSARKFIDIGANLTDLMFSGIYNGSQKHTGDLREVLLRAYNAGLEKIIVTCGCLEDLVVAKSLCASDEHLFFTAGIHPTRCQDFAKDPIACYDKLKSCIKDNPDRVVAVGECGLDYDREHFCPADVQRTYFEKQLHLAHTTGLPLFLHCRRAHTDLLDLLRKHISEFGPVTGVVHTFDGTAEQASDFINLGLYVGFNGCSLKLPENLKVVSEVPVERILLETDAPWCDIRPTHAGYQYVKTKFERKKPNKWDAKCMVAGRNEPANIVQVLEVVAAVRGISEDELAETVYQNTLTAFPHLAH
ncbi:TatD DNase [Sparganum proliferum]